METTENQKVLLTLKEAAEYFGIGINTLRRLTNKHTSLDCQHFFGQFL